MICIADLGFGVLFSEEEENNSSAEYTLGYTSWLERARCRFRSLLLKYVWIQCSHISLFLRTHTIDVSKNQVNQEKTEENSPEAGLSDY